jgi:hypothetical protein
MSTDASDTLFREEQRNRQAFTWVLFIGVIGFVAGILGYIAKTEPKKAPQLVVPAVALGVIFFVLAIFLAMLKLTVRIDPQTIDIWFFPLRRRVISLRDVISWEACAYQPLMEFKGWGIKRSRNGEWAYSMSGDRGVRLVLSNGERLLIGSQRPEELVLALNQARGS